MTVTDRSTLPTPRRDAGYKVAAFEGFCVAPVRRLLVRGAVDIIEDRTGQSPLGQTPKIMKVMTIAQNHACSRANPSVHQTARRGDLKAATEQIETTQEFSNSPRLNLARRRILRCRLSIAYTSNRGRQVSAVQGLENRAHGAMLFWDADQTFEKSGLARLASMSFRRRSGWLAWLLPKPKVLELPGHSAFNRT